jgi:hypothetical protein
LPPFAKIAGTPELTGAALFEILQTPHAGMPGFVIPTTDKADVVAYVLSLQKQRNTRTLSGITQNLLIFIG